MNTTTPTLPYGYMPCGSNDVASAMLCGDDGKWSPNTYGASSARFHYCKPITHGPDSKPWAESEWEMVKEGDGLALGDLVLGGSGWRSSPIIPENAARDSSTSFCYARRKQVKEPQINCPPVCQWCGKPHHKTIECSKETGFDTVRKEINSKLKELESDTPRTDAVFYSSPPDLEKHHFARQLERELNESNKATTVESLNILRENIALKEQLESRPAQWPTPITDRLPTKEDGKFVLVFDDGAKLWCGVPHHAIKPYSPWLPQPPAPIPQKSEAEIAWETFGHSPGHSGMEEKDFFIAGFNAAKGTK